MAVLQHRILKVVLIRLPDRNAFGKRSRTKQEGLCASPFDTVRSPPALLQRSSRSRRQNLPQKLPSKSGIERRKVPSHSPSWPVVVLLSALAAVDLSLGTRTLQENKTSILRAPRSKKEQKIDSDETQTACLSYQLPESVARCCGKAER